MTPLVFDDPLAFIASYLNNRLPAVTTRVTLPDETPLDPWPETGRLIVPRFDGGTRIADVRALWQFGFQVWAPTLTACLDLAGQASALITDSQNTGPVLAARATIPYPVNDAAERHRSYFTAVLTVRGHDL
jgi:hypothetical protein